MHTTLLRGSIITFSFDLGIFHEPCKDVLRISPDNPLWLGFDLRRFVSNCRLYEVIAKHGLNKEYINIGQALMTIAFKGHQAFRWWLTIKSFLKQT